MSEDNAVATRGTLAGDGWSLERVTTLAGPVAVVVSFVAVFGSVVLASWVAGNWFTWTGNALSHLGEAGRASASVFNYGLILAGALGVVFAWRTWRAATNAWHRLGAVLLAIALLNAGLVGVFPVPHDLHGPVALVFFFTLTLGLFAHGSGDAIGGRPHRGVRSIWYGVAHVAAWVALSFVPFSGIALPELVGVLGLWAWTGQMYLDVAG